MTWQMLELFLEFYDLEIYGLVSSSMLKKKGCEGRGYVSLVHACRNGIQKSYVNYSNRKRIVEDAMSCDSVEFYDGSRYRAVLNIFKGCQTLEEMQIRKDLADEKSG